MNTPIKHASNAKAWKDDDGYDKLHANRLIANLYAE